LLARKRPIRFRRHSIPVINRDRDRNGGLVGDARNGQPGHSSEPNEGGMSDSGTSPGVRQPEPREAGLEPDPHRFRPPYVSFWLRELPYVIVLILTLFGVAYASISRQSMIGFWEFLAPVIGLLCIGIGWPRAADKAARLRLVWTQALHWLAFLVAMNLLLLSGVASMLSPDATGLTILTLLALGTFVAGVHTQAWQICVLGMIMGLGVPAIAWIERSALLLLLGGIAVAAIGGALWWSMSGKRAGPAK
jgi:hypothetical protein